MNILNLEVARILEMKTDPEENRIGVTEMEEQIMTDEGKDLGVETDQREGGESTMIAM